MLTEADLLPGLKHIFWKMAKIIILYVWGKKPGPFPKGWMGQVVQVLHGKAGEAIDETQNVIMVNQMEEEWTPI